MSRALLGKVATATGIVLLVGIVGFVAKAWYDSRIPGTYSVMDYGRVDDGGGTPIDAHAAHEGGTSVSELHGPATGTPDARFELTARHTEIRLSSGRTVDALTFTGKAQPTSPGLLHTSGPEIRVEQGDLVEIVLRNEDVEQGVTIHWHGVDVPNAEDGVAGVTQDAVLPGDSYTYRFRADQVGTFWYHSHQVSSEEVRRGLFGAFVIEPRGQTGHGVDLVATAHTFDGIPTLNGDDSGYRERVPAGTPVRIRLVNTDNVLHRFTVTGTPFRVLAIDGTELNEPGLLENTALPLAAGGRMDIGYVQRSRAVRVDMEGGPWIALSPWNGPPPDESSPTGAFDPLSYGRPAPTPFDAPSAFDRRFSLDITKKIGFFDGRPGRQWAINGGIYPDVPMFLVEEDDLVEVTISNDSGVHHPMHLHGHHALVLSRDGKPATGSPWWVDTLNVGPGESYVIAFRADNPGIWMDHCHNLGHAAAGLTMHVAYSGVTTPFRIGGTPGNEPE